MNMNEVRELLALVEGYERTPVPPAALDVWFAELRDVSYEDAAEAIRHHYRTAGTDKYGAIRRVLPVDVRRVAKGYHETRMRALARQALPAPTVRRGSMGRPAAVEAMLAEARAKAERASAKIHARDLASVA
jgi:hypothetical protein